MSTIEYRSEDRLVWITLCRPQVKNAIDRAMNAELWDAWRKFESDPGADVAILTGSGTDAFCAGADLADYIPAWFDKTILDLRRNVASGLGGITRGLHRTTKPIIAAVNGWALAGGFELALACDLRIASTAARFGSFEIRRGFHHGDGGIVRLLAMLGLSRTMDLVLTGREVDAEEALRIGLVSTLVAPDQLLSTAEQYARRIASYSQVAVRSAKQTILEVIGRRLDDALQLEALFGYSSGNPEDVRQRLEQFFGSRGSAQRQAPETGRP
jgi:enoyl-CoA hydratase/carnithine racemase